MGIRFGHEAESPACPHFPPSHQCPCRSREKQNMEGNRKDHLTHGLFLTQITKCSVSATQHCRRGAALCSRAGAPPSMLTQQHCVDTEGEAGLRPQMPPAGILQCRDSTGSLPAPQNTFQTQAKDTFSHVQSTNWSILQSLLPADFSTHEFRFHKLNPHGC